MNVTISDIAKRAGVTDGTVSRILSGRTTPTYRPAIRRAEQIRRIATELGYRPNAAARQVRAQRFNAAASISKRQIEVHNLNVAKGLARGLARRHMHLIFAEAEFAKEGRAELAPRLMRELCVDGLVVNAGGDLAQDFMDHVNALAVPAVYVNTAGEHDCVNPDDRDAAQRLAQSLLDAGHRRIGCVGLDPRRKHVEHYSLKARAEAMSRVFEHADADVRWFAPDHAASLEHTERLLREHADRTAWVVNRHAARFCHAAERSGLRIPRDLSVVTFMMAQHEHSALPVTGMALPMIAVGEAGAEMLVRKIKDPTTHQPVEWVPWDDEPGQTLGPPRDR